MFQAVPADLIPEVWAEVSPGLEVIKRRCKTPWIVREIKTHLMEARATLFLHAQGFVILERCKAFTGEPYLNVWLMWFKPGEAMKIKGELVAWLYAMKKHHRCEWWQFGSPRDEWAETIAPYCDKVMTIWRSK